MSRISVTVEIDGSTYVQEMTITQSCEFYTGAPSGIAEDFGAMASGLVVGIEKLLVQEYGDKRERRAV